MKKHILSLFDYSGHIKNEFILNGCSCSSLDNIQNKQNNSVTFVTDFLDFNYNQFLPGYFDFIFIAFPCTTFSRASGGFHFKNNRPITREAVGAINMIFKLKILLDYYNCPFLLENPTSAIGKSHYFKILGKLECTRLTFKNFGYPTRKQTDLFFNFPMLLLSPVTYRVNGQYQAQSLDNLSYRSRVTYPKAFVKWIVQNILKNL